MEGSPSPQQFAAQELSVSLCSHGSPLPIKWPDITVVDLDREQGAEFNCPCSRAGRTVHGNACFSAKMASVGKLVSGHKAWHSVPCPLPFMRERLLESHPTRSHFQSGKHWELICAMHLKSPSVVEHTPGSTLCSWKLMAGSPARGVCRASRSSAISERGMCSRCLGVAGDLTVYS